MPSPHASTPSKPPLRPGFRVPFHELSPDDFPQFVFAVLGPLGRAHGFRPMSSPDGSGDGGIDIEARSLANDEEIIAIQCKRYGTSLSLGTVAAELAKAALTSYLEGSNVVEHFTISSSPKRTKNLDPALRETQRTRLIEEACAQAKMDKDLQNRWKEAEARGASPKAIIETFIKGLRAIRAWCGKELDAKLGECWSDIQGALEKYFAVQVALREYPRPDFDEIAYLTQSRQDTPKKSVPPFAKVDDLPPNLVPYSAANPLAEARAAAPPNAATMPNQPLPEILAATPYGNCTILTGPGGAGKTHALALTREVCARKRLETYEGPMPILLDLRAYQGDLKRLIHAALGIQHGVWLSIPGRFLVLCDGLQALSHEHTTNLEREVQQLRNQYPDRIAWVISIRDTGLRARTVWSRIDNVLGVALFQLRQARSLAKQILPSAMDADAFMLALEQRFSMANAPSFLALPYCLAESLFLFKRSKALPETLSELLEAILDGRFEHNAELALTPESVGVDKGMVRALAEEVMFAARVEHNVATIGSNDAGPLFQRAIARVRERGCLGADDLKQRLALELLCHYEFLSRPSDGAFRLPHDLLVGYLAAGPLSRAWRKYVETLAESRADDAWVFACRRVPEAELEDFFGELRKKDLLLAARAGREAGGKALDFIAHIILVLDRGHTETEYSVWKTAMAMGILQTEACRERARENAQLPDDWTLRAMQNRRALALMGDEQVLWGEIHGNSSEGEEQRRPDRALLSYAPPTRILQLARRFLDHDDTRDPKSLWRCLEILSAFGEDSDVARVERVFDEAGEDSLLQSAFRCLHRLNPALAIEKLKRLMVPEGVDLGSKIEWATWLSAVGADIGGEWALNVFLDGPTDHGNAKLDAILDAAPFTETMKRRLLKAFMKREVMDERRGSLWGFAGRNNLAEFDTHVMSAIQSDEIGAACSLLAHRNLSAEEKEPFVEAIARRIEEPQTVDRFWAGPLILEFLQKNGREALALAIGAEWLRSLFKVQRHLRLGGEPEAIGIVDRVFVAAQLKEKQKYNWRLEGCIHQLMKALGPFGHQLEPTGFEEALYRPFSGTSDDHVRVLREFFKVFPDDTLNARLSELEDDPADRFGLLCLVTSRLSHSRRVELFRNTLAEVVDEPDSMSKAREFVEAGWCEELAEAIVSAIAAKHDWDSETGGQYFEETARSIGARLSKAWAERFVSPWLKRKPHPQSRRFLQLWSEMAADRRGT